MRTRAEFRCIRFRIAIVHEDSIFGSTAAKAIDQYAKAAGINVVESVSYNRASNDLSSVVLRARAARPDVLFLASYIPDGTLACAPGGQRTAR